MGSDNKIQRLQEEIEQKQKEIEMLKKVAESAIKPLEEYSIADKIKFFDSIYASALSMIKKVEEGGYADEDDEHYLFEGAFSILNIGNTKSLWKYYNSLT